MVFLTVYLIVIQQGSGATSLYWSSSSSWVSTTHLCSPQRMNKRRRVRMTRPLPPSQAPALCRLVYPINHALFPRQDLPLPLLLRRPAGNGALMPSSPSLPPRGPNRGPPPVVSICWQHSSAVGRVFFFSSFPLLLPLGAGLGGLLLVTGRAL